MRRFSIYNWPRQKTLRIGALTFLIDNEHGYAIMQNLIARGVIGDFRAPDYMRFGFSPLFMRYADIRAAVEVLQDILTTKSYEKAEYQALNAVT